MSRTCIALLLFAQLSGFVCAQDGPKDEPAPAEPVRVYAWYRPDGVKARGAAVTEWEASGAPSGRSLTHAVGTPKLVRVGTPGGDRTVVRFDGQSALWQPSTSWGSLGGERTVVAYLRLAPKANGFLFDGSTNSGMTRAQVRDGKWQAGVQSPPIKNADLADAATHEPKAGEWQVHTFTFKKAAKGTDVAHHQGHDKKAVTAEATSPLGGFILGANVATKLGLACDVAEVIVYDRVVDAVELKAVAAYLTKKWGSPADLPAEKQPRPETLPDDPRLFRTVLRKNGDDKVHTYRIPGLATTPKGTLVAVFDIRHKSGADLPGDIDVGMMRSTDDGKTWSAMTRIMDYAAGEAGSRGNGVGDPAILVDRKTGTIFVAALRSKGNRAWFGSGPGLTPDETGQFVICQSTDDGLTWSKPVSITPQVKDPDWLLCFQGPGNGIQLKDGTLVFPAQYKGKDKVPHSCFVASTDGGKNWTISPPAVPGDPPTSECAVAELADGSLLLSMRNEARGGKRVWARWEWKDTITKGKWGEHWLAVTDPTCMASLISHPHGELVLSNPNNAKRRDHLTIRTSNDGGKTWSTGQLLDPGTAMYSCLTVLNDGRIGVVYENGEGLVFARFPLKWVLESGRRKDPPAPNAPPPKPALAPVFQNSMVLQRGTPVPVWGTAEAGTSVTVTLAGQRKETKVDVQGKWSITLAAMKADDVPRELKVVAGDVTLTVRDVLVGDVWIAAGQSNMEWPLAGDAHAKAELPAAEYPNLRLLNLNYAGQSTAVFGPEVLERLTPDAYYRGSWRPCTPASAPPFSAVAYYFGKELHVTLRVPVGVIHLAVGGSPTEAWIRREAMAADKELAPLLLGNWLDNESQGAWCRRRGRDNLAAALKGNAAVPGDEAGPNHPFKPGFLWDAGIARLAPFPIRGVIWYQGESNSLDLRRVRQHERLFPLLVADWRKQWGVGEFPFLYCQLSSIGTEKGYQSQHWPEFRDGQRRMLADIPNSGMAVTSDVGHPTDVHPRNKKEVGRRLALWALARTYDRKVAHSGPLAQSVRRDGSALVVTFDHADGGLQTGDGKPAAGFEIAGEDGVFRPAEGKIEKGAVALTSPLVTTPVAARYGWQPFSTGNLTNGAMLPASTFVLTLPRN